MDISNPGCVKIIDLGNGKILRENHDNRLSTNLGGAGRFCSPERTRNALLYDRERTRRNPLPYDSAKDDVWAAAGIVIEMVSGVNTFISLEIPRLLDAVRSIHPPLANVLGSVFVDDPNVRPNSTQIADELNELII